MQITKKQVEEFLIQAFDSGYSGCFDLREQVVEELLSRIDSSFVMENKILTMEEYNNLPIGTVLSNPILGTGAIQDDDGKKIVIFEGSDVKKRTVNYYNNTFPWTEPFTVNYSA